MFFSICNEVSIRNHILNGDKSILIRILEPGDKLTGPTYIINNMEQYQDVLELYIDDTITGYETINKENTFDKEKAKILNDFILKNDFDEVVVHCSLGISRSPAVMICVAKILDNKELENIIKANYKFYNSYIVDTFTKSDYSIKKIDTNNVIAGNILCKNCATKAESETETDLYILKKIFK